MKTSKKHAIKYFCVGATLCCAVSATAASADVPNEVASMNGVESMQQATKTISGTVKDAMGEPIIGASILVKGTTTGVITDFDGNFVLENVDENAVLEISYIGFTTQTVSVAGKTVFNIVMQEETQTIDEVVVTALGIKREKRSLGYSTTTVGGDEFTQARDLNMGNALSGKVPGLSVTGNSTGIGGSSRVVIRGNASLTGNNQPLYVVDGVPFDNTNLGSAGTWGGMDMGDGLSNINADDIESIQVLKGAAASALYGYRGGNGAILITTKSGKKGKPMSVEFNNNLQFNMIYDMRDFQDVFGQGTYGQKPTTAETAIQTETSSWGARMDGSDAVNFLGETYEYSPINNWKNFYRTGITETASVALSGAGEKITYRFGLSNMYDRSILPNSSISQQGINLNTTYDILSNLHLSVNANYVFEKFNGRSNLSDGNGNTNASLLHRANSFDVRWLKGVGGEGVDESGSELLGGDNVYFNNPYFLQYMKTNNTNKNRLTGGMTLKWEITDWLYAQGSVTRDGYNMDFKQVQPIGAAADPQGFMTEYSKTYSEVNLNYLIGFNKTWGDWSVGATIGGNTQRNITKQWMIDGGRPFIIDGLWSSNNVSTNGFKKMYTEYRVNSVYATADFGFKNQLFLNLTGRNDWFSTLDPDNNHYFYPSATLSWVFTDTFDAPDWFTFGKIRGAYASASNGTTAYQNMLAYKLLDWKMNGKDLATVNNTTYPNEELKPVRITEYEVGLNLSFLDNRLSFDAAYYNKNTKDDIAMVTTSNASGFTSSIKNVGEIQNQGFELLVNFVPVSTQDFRWNSTFNIAYNDSEVKYLGEVFGKPVESLSIDGATSRSGGVSIQNIVGKPYGEIVGKAYKRSPDGKLIFGEDNIPLAADEVSSLGNGVYKVTGGWHNEFTYKNFTLSFLIDFKAGADLFSGSNYSFYGEGLHKETLKGRESNYTVSGYKQASDGTLTPVDITIVASGANTAANQVNAQDYYSGIAGNNIAEEFIYNASFIKLRELSFGYTFPKSMLGKQKAIKGLSISLVGRNLWTILKHTDNIDPESAYNNTNGQGLELNGYPAQRSVGFNVNIKF